MRVAEVLQSYPPSVFRGVEPECRLVLGRGFSVRQWKDQMLREGVALCSSAIVDSRSFYRELASAQKPVRRDRVLGSFARQEVLRHLLAVPEMLERFPELRKRRRQRSFFKKLDRAIQSGLHLFAHWEEEEVINQRLNERMGKNNLREEVRQLARAYEIYIAHRELYDPPSVLKLALDAIGDASLGSVVFVNAAKLESLEALFWERFTQSVEVRRLSPPEDLPDSDINWTRWHTLDDAVENLDSRAGVLLGQDPGAERSLLRGFGDGLCQPDEFVSLQNEEWHKRALLSLEVLASGFERQKVQAWIEDRFPARGDWVKEIQSRGIQRGLKSYRGGFLQECFQALQSLARTFPSRMSLPQLSRAHLSELRTHLPEAYFFFEKHWNEFGLQMQLVHGSQRKRPILYWLERLKQKLETAKAPGAGVEYEGGLSCFRSDSFPVAGSSELTFFGFPASFLESEKLSSYWHSERDRDVLSAEFAVRGSMDARQERMRLVREWLRSAKRVKFLDAEYTAQGGERESLFTLLKECTGRELQPESHGGSARWLSSYSCALQTPSLEFTRPGEAPSEMEATELDRYSRCSFQALGGYRWKLRDLREPGMDLWPDARGTILHEAVERLCRDSSLSASQALEIAWELKRPRGLLQGRRIEAHAKDRMRLVLERFLEMEQEYVRRSGTKIFQLEDPDLLTLLYEGTTIRGRPDRIDAHPDGLFVMDYKTSSTVPAGKEMVELGYGLQLPFYALAASQKFSKKILGVQFVQLTPKGARTRGILSKKYNGKDEGMLTQSRGYTSLIEGELDSIWEKMNEHLREHIKKYREGIYEAVPKKETECRACGYQNLCGIRRARRTFCEAPDGA